VPRPIDLSTHIKIDRSGHENNTTHDIKENLRIKKPDIYIDRVVVKRNIELVIMEFIIGGATTDKIM